jgi:hypothetical protein
MGKDLRMEPGDQLLDRLVSQPPPPAPNQPPNPPVDLSLNPLGTPSVNPPEEKEAEGRDRVKLSFYVKAKQRDQYDLLLVHARGLLPKAEGRRLDQSALIRIILDGVAADFYSSAASGDSRLAEWLRRAAEQEKLQ